MEFCLDCSAEMPEDAIHCYKCGKKLPRPKKNNKNRVPISYDEARKYLDEDIWIALGNANIKDLVLVDGKRVDYAKPLTKKQEEDYYLQFLGEEYSRIWIAAGKPDIREFTEGIKAQIEDVRLSAANQEDEITFQEASESDVRSWMDHENYQRWIELGRPKVLKDSMGQLGFEFQIVFHKLYGYFMDDYLIDVWIFAGQPPIEYWDVNKSMDFYRESMMRKMEGLSSIGQINNSVQQTGNFLASLFAGAQSSNGLQCSSCRMTIPSGGSKCPYCQEKTRIPLWPG